MESNAILNQPVPRSLRILGSLDGVKPAEWNALSGGNPTVAYEFLDSLHRTGCVDPAHPVQCSAGRNRDHHHALRPGFPGEAGWTPQSPS